MSIRGFIIKRLFKIIFWLLCVKIKMVAKESIVYGNILYLMLKRH